MTESRHRQASNQRRIWTVGLIGFLLLSVVSGLLHAGTASASTLSRSPWQQFGTAVIVDPCPASFHGDTALYNCAPAVPDANDPGWGPAPDPDTINFHSVSRLNSCLTGADFNFFQTFVNVPLDVNVTSFTVTFSDTDDGARATIFNSVYPSGLVVPDSFVFLGGTQTTGNLAQFLASGEINRVVVTQVDDCPVGNNLGSAAIVLNGEAVPVCVAPPSGMVGWWPGDGNANDIVGGNHGTLQNGATATAAGRVDQAFSFDGVNDYVQIPNAALNNMAAGTIDMWIFPTENGGNGTFGFGRPWFAKQHNNVNSYAVFAFKSPTDSKALFHLNNQAPNVFGTTALTLNTWHHVAATWDGSFIRVYVDGVQDGQVASTQSLPFDLGSVTSIGGWTGDGNNFFEGLIDEVEIFNRALSAEEIQAIFLAGSAGKCKNQSPDALCKNVTVNTSPGLCTAPASVNNGSSDPDGDPITLAQSPTGPYGKGATNVTLTVTDDKGASDSCTATVTVVDNQAPSITCPAPQTVECTGAGSAVASFSATATDNCGFASTSCPASGSSFPLGTTPVSCSASDDSNNSSSCSSSVTVQDTTAPTVSCVESVNPSGKNVPKASNTNQDGFYKVSGGDVCSTPVIKIGGFTLANGETIKITQTPGKSGVSFVNTMGPAGIRHFQVGPGDAVITATDGSGNQASVTCLVPPPPK